MAAIPAHGEDEYNLIAPTLADSTIVSGGTTLGWEPCEDQDFSLFRVYRDDGGGPVLVHETGGTGWFDAVEDGWRFDYTVTAVDFSGNESMPGEAATTVGVGDRPVPSRRSRRPSHVPQACSSWTCWQEPAGATETSFSAAC